MLTRLSKSCGRPNVSDVTLAGTVALRDPAA